jgi:hypothetical protein
MTINTNKTILFNGLKLVNPIIQVVSTLDLPQQKKAVVEVKFSSETYSHARQIGSFDYENSWSDIDVEEFINEWILEHEFVEEN